MKVWNRFMRKIRELFEQVGRLAQALPRVLLG